VRVTGAEAKATQKSGDRGHPPTQGYRLNEVWSWDFVHDVTTTGEPFRCLKVKDEATRWCLAIEVDRSLTHQRVIEVLQRLLVLYGRPRYIRSDNGPELIAQGGDLGS
jgi:putative transposase